MAKSSDKERAIRAYVEICFILCNDMSFEEMAHIVDVSESTIRRLDKGGASERTHAGTLVGLAKAAKVEAFPTPKGFSMKLKRA